VDYVLFQLRTDQRVTGEAGEEGDVLQAGFANPVPGAVGAEFEAGFVRVEGFLGEASGVEEESFEICFELFNLQLLEFLEAIPRLPFNYLLSAEVCDVGLI